MLAPKPDSVLRSPLPDLTINRRLQLDVQEAWPPVLALDLPH